MDEHLNQRAVIVVAGAGSIGRWVGGMLQAGGRDVRFLARSGFIQDAEKSGLALSDRDGGEHQVQPDEIRASDEPQILADADVVLVTVKSKDTESMATLIAEHAKLNAIVVSLQNGARNPDRLRAHLPAHDVRAGMVPFNVVQRSATEIHRASSGHVMVQTGPTGGLAALLSVPGLAVQERDDMEAVLWGKVLINLNNAVNALSGLPLRAQLLDPQWRRVMAACVDEGLATLAKAGITPAKVAGLPPKALPTLLRAPTWVFRMIAARSIKVDPEARSSMQDDLVAGRPTEIDDLQGAIVRLAASHCLSAPTCARVVELIREVERGERTTTTPGEILPVATRSD